MKRVCIATVLLACFFISQNTWAKGDHLSIGFLVGPEFSIKPSGHSLFFFGPEFGYSNFKLPVSFAFDSGQKIVLVEPKYKLDFEIYDSLFLSPAIAALVKFEFGNVDVFGLGVGVGPILTYFITEKIGLVIEPANFEFLFWQRVAGESHTDLHVAYRLNVGAEYVF